MRPLKYSTMPWNNPGTHATIRKPATVGPHGPIALDGGGWFPPGDPRNNPNVIDPVEPVEPPRTRDEIIADNNALWGEGRWAFSRANGPSNGTDSGGTDPGIAGNDSIRHAPDPRALQGMIPTTERRIIPTQLENTNTACLLPECWIQPQTTPPNVQEYVEHLRQYLNTQKPNGYQFLQYVRTDPRLELAAQQLISEAYLRQLGNHNSTTNSR